MPEPIYLDHNATTPLDPEVEEAMRAASAQGFANPASQHAAGRRARQLLEDARERIADLLGANLAGPAADRLIFTSGGTEANNLALFGLAGQPPAAIVLAPFEHPSISAAAAELARRGHLLISLPVGSDGLAQSTSLDIPRGQRPALVTLMLANNETGVLQPVAQAAERCLQLGIPLHTDAVQAAGKLPIDFRRLGPATLALAAHKFNGPRGIGALLVRSDVRLTPLLRGGAQQNHLRPGTECTVLAVGMCRALELWEQRRDERYQRLRQLRDEFEHRITAEFPDVVVHGAQAPRLPNTTSLSFPGINRQALVIALDMVGVECSTGSACASGSSEPSATLTAMQLDNALIQSAIRFSFGAFQAKEEVAAAIERTIRVVRRLRNLPPNSTPKSPQKPAISL